MSNVLQYRSEDYIWVFTCLTVWVGFFFVFFNSLESSDKTTDFSNISPKCNLKFFSLLFVLEEEMIFIGATGWDMLSS